MANVYSNALNLFNLTTKATPVSGDLLALGDSAVTGVPLKQCTVGSLPFAPIGGSTVFNVTTATQAMVIDAKYFVNYTGGACTLTLPTAASSIQGAYVQIRGGEANTAGYVIVLNSGQTIRMFGNVTTVTTGSLTVPGNFDSLTIECDATSGGLTWNVTGQNTSGSVLIQ
jgi:hypothetical protein